MVSSPKNSAKHVDGLPEHVVYAGFWLRVWASLLDTMLVLMIVLPILRWWDGAGFSPEYSAMKLPTDLPGDMTWPAALGLLVRGPLDFVVSWVLPAIGVLAFWIYRSATPGKMAIGARIVDAEHLTEPTVKQLVGRYFAYYLSMLPLIPPLGMLWVAFDRRKQGWHDKLAGTVVVRERRCRKKREVRG